MASEIIKQGKPTIADKDIPEIKIPVIMDTTVISALSAEAILAKKTELNITTQSNNKLLWIVENSPKIAAKLGVKSARYKSLLLALGDAELQIKKVNEKYALSVDELQSRKSKL
jgi:hypothetical protein